MMSLFKYTPDKELTHEETMCIINAEIASLESILRLSKEACYVLLQSFKWDKESLLIAFFTNTNTEKFLVEHGVVAERRDDLVIIIQECPICCMIDQVLDVGCNHLACEECWKQYLKTKIQEDQISIECMHVDCNIVIDSERMEKFLEDPTLVEYYQKLLVDEYVEASSEIVRCPVPECRKIIKHHQVKSGLVCCPCGVQFCYLCGDEHHAPATCRQFKIWKNKCKGYQSALTDEQSMEWLEQNTKECPKCSIMIQKNGGCSEMKCTNKKCRFRFCWHCLEPLTLRHSPFCSITFKKDTESQLNNSSRFTSYFKDFQYHEEQLQKNQKMCATVMKKVKNTNSSKHLTLFKELASLLLDSRRIQMYACVFGYYLRDEESSGWHQQFLKNLEQDTNEIEIELESFETLETSEYNNSIHHTIQSAKKSREELLKFCASSAISEEAEARVEIEENDFEYTSNFWYYLVLDGICGSFCCLMILYYCHCFWNNY